MPEKRKRGRPRKHPLPQAPQPQPSPTPAEVSNPQLNPRPKDFGTGLSSESERETVSVFEPLDEFDRAAESMPLRITEAGEESVGVEPGSAEPGAEEMPEGEVISPGRLYTEKGVAPFAMMPIRVLVKRFGEKWEMDGDEKAAYVSLLTAFLNKEAPEWLRESENKELYSLLFVVGCYAAGRSETAERFVTNLWDKLTSILFPSGDGTDTPASSENPAAENHS